MIKATSPHGQLPLPVDFPPAVPALLAFVAGYVDVTTFLAFNGLFVAQATGSLVVAGAAIETGDAAFVKVAAIPVFLLAGIATTAAIRSFGADKASAFAMTLLGEGVIIGGLIVTSLLFPGDTTFGPLCGLAAMGVQSATARLLLSSYGSTNVMTSNITQLSIDLEDTIAAYIDGRRAPAALSGVERLGLVILAFLLGVVIGGVGYHVAGMAGLALMIATLVALAVWALSGGGRLNPPPKGEQNA